MADSKQELKLAAEEIGSLTGQVAYSIRLQFIKACGLEYQLEFQSAMSEGRSPAGVAHTPLKKVSAYPAKKHRNPSNIPLRDKENMLKSFGYTTDSDKSTEISNTAPYAQYHQEGRPKLPVRQLVGVSQAVPPRVRKSITTFNETEAAYADALVEALTDAQED